MQGDTEATHNRQKSGDERQYKSCHMQIPGRCGRETGYSERDTHPARLKRKHRCPVGNLVFPLSVVE